jgi:sulfur carrier protein ThiS
LILILDGSKDILQEGRSLEQRQEEAFAIHSQERIMGLLGAMIPKDSKVCVNVNGQFLVKEYLVACSNY